MKNKKLAIKQEARDTRIAIGCFRPGRTLWADCSCRVEPTDSVQGAVRVEGWASNQL